MGKFGQDNIQKGAFEMGPDGRVGVCQVGKGTTLGRPIMEVTLFDLITTKSQDLGQCLAHTKCSINT